MKDVRCDDLSYTNWELSDDEMDQTVQLFREQRRQMGVEKADEAWFCDPLDDWLACLSGGRDGTGRDGTGRDGAGRDGTARTGRRRSGAAKTGGGGLSRESVAALAVGMREKLAFRDALIVSLVCPQADRDHLLELGVRPHRPQSVRYLCGVLDDTFRDPGTKPEGDRATRGFSMLTQILASVPENYQAQPLAVLAYMLWWMGDARAVADAVRALAYDERCTLAAIVLSAVEHGICPAWLDPEHAGNSPEPVAS